MHGKETEPQDDAQRERFTCTVALWKNRMMLMWGGLKGGDTGPASGANRLTKRDGKNETCESSKIKRKHGEHILHVVTAAG